VGIGQEFANESHEGGGGVRMTDWGGTEEKNKDGRRIRRRKRGDRE
jgi:hypothetical protein